MLLNNLWVVFDDERHLSVKEPYGVVLKLYEVRYGSNETNDTAKIDRQCDHG